MTRPTPNELYREIQVLVRQGQPVFPCRSTYVDDRHKDKAPLTKNGLKDATLDLGIIKRWWRANGESAIGLPTGIIWDVLDVDTKNGVDGRAHLPRLRELGLLEGCQRLVKTPSGGWHLYFTATPGLTNKARAALGLDVRGKGGYVLAPPSYLVAEDYEGQYVEHAPIFHKTNEGLRWDDIISCLAPQNEVTREPIAILPSERRGSLASLREWVSNLQPGERNNGLHWAVCRCIENGLDPHELLEPALLAGLGEDEVLLTINSAMRRAGVAPSELVSEAEALFPDEV